MTSKTPHKFPAGNRIAADNNNQRKMRIRKSPLRSTLKKLQALEEKAMDNIKKSVNAESVDKSVVDSSKWVIQQLQAVSKAASLDEELINGTRAMLNEAERQEAEAEREAAESEEEKPRFSLVQLPTKKDL